jgi:LCP family protein required for cell wall assembly
LPQQWLVVGVIAVVAVVCGLASGLWLMRPHRHPALYSLLCVVSAAVAAVAIYGAVAVHSVSSAIANMTPPSSSSLRYDVLVFNNHSDDIKTLGVEFVGYLGTDRHSGDARELLDAEVSTGYIQRDDPTALALGLRSGDFQAILVEDSIFKGFEEADPTLFNALKVVKVIFVTIDTSSSRGGGDVTKPFIVYIQGIDQYGALQPRGLSDVIMLVAVNPITGHILMLNTPRDYYVQLHDTEGYPDKLTHAGTYGVDMSIETLQDLYGIKIDFWVRVNFDSVIRLVDALGGVDVESAEAFTCVHGGFRFTQGINNMNGEKALCFARERYNVDGGDHGRGKNQQRLLTGLIDKIIDPSILTRYSSVLDAVEGRMEMSFTADDVALIVRKQLSSGEQWTIDTTAVGGTGSSQPTYTFGSEMLYVMLPNMDQVSAAAAQMLAVLAER